MLTISFVIPTINRPAQLKRVLDSFTRQTVKPNKIIIVDQEGVESNFSQYNLPISYYQVDFKSLTRARNFGVEKCETDVVGFLDDDIVLVDDYVENVLSFFDKNKKVLGVQGLITNFESGHVAKVGGNSFVYWLYNLLAKIFLLNNSSTTNRLLLSGRNQYASRPSGIQKCEWLSGIGNYRREVFKEFKFDENLAGYALGEDKLFSYPIGEKYPGSLFLDPSINCEHHHADIGRPQNREWVDMKVRYTHYLWNKLLRTKKLALLAYWWANFGDLLVVLFSVILVKNSFKFFWWHLADYWKILRNKQAV